MRLQHLTLKGFLCYKDLTTVTFHPNFNVIVGPNGSGKSSILAALRFVLGDSPGDRTAYLHHGGSSRVLVGFVSAQFENSSGVILGAAANAGEITIRRDFGVDKNEYTLNGKHVTKRELQSLLETAGFNQSNPFYFVQQHEISNLARMSNEDRYLILKDVSGIRVYEERRAEAAENLARTRQERGEIEETLRAIAARIQELAGEQAELEKVLATEKEVATLTHLLQADQLRSLTDQITALEAARAARDDEAKTLGFRIQELERDLEDRRSAIDAAAQRVKAAAAAEAELATAAGAAAKERATLNAQREGCAQSLESEREALERHRVQLAGVESRLQPLEQDRQRASRALDALRAKMNDLTVRKVAQAREKEVLVRKASSKAQFTSLAQRNAALRAERSAKQTRLESLEADLARAKSDLAAHAAAPVEDPAALRAELEEQQAAAARAAQAAADARRDLVRCKEQVRELHASAAELRKAASAEESAMWEARRRLDRTVRGSQLNAISASSRWAAEAGEGEERIFWGTLLSNLRVEPKYFIAVETAGGAQLFNLLVRDRSAAVRLLERLKAERTASAATVVPLRDVRLDQFPPYPSRTARVRPLVGVIDCPAEVLPAVKQVFARYLLVDTADTAREFAVRRGGGGFDCITLEGDVVSRKGLLSGGHRGNQSRLRSHHAAAAAEQRLRDLAERLRDAERRSLDVEREQQQGAEAVVRAEQRKSELQFRMQDAADRLRQATDGATAASTARDRLAGVVHSLESEGEGIRADLAALDKELSSRSFGHLSSSESARLEELTAELAKTEEKLAALASKCEKSAAETATVTQELEVELPRQIAQLRCAISERELLVADLSSDLSVLAESAKAAGAAEAQAEATRKNAVAEVQRARKALHAKESEVEAGESAIADVRASQETAVTAANAAIAKLADLTKRSDSVVVQTGTGLTGPRDVDLERELAERPREDIERRLAQAAKRLRAMPPVNRQALEQHCGFSEEQSRLLAESQHLVKAEEAVVQLMDRVDAQLEDTLLKTFEKVNSAFVSIFSEIVPAGRAHLVLKQRRSGAAIQEQQQTRRAGDEFVGLGIKVSFAPMGTAERGTSRNYQSLEALSGGQKSVTALALMFALQQLDAAPFYILDEVDASLDTGYRAAVAALIQRQARTCQYIATSHKQQTVEAADYHLCTVIRDQVSIVESIGRALALKISQRQGRLLAQPQSLLALEGNQENEGLVAAV